MSNWRFINVLLSSLRVGGEVLTYRIMYPLTHTRTHTHALTHTLSIFFSYVHSFIIFLPQMGAFHSIEMELHRKFTLTKPEWDEIALERVGTCISVNIHCPSSSYIPSTDSACDPTQRADVLAVVMQEGVLTGALVAVSHSCFQFLIRLYYFSSSLAHAYVISSHTHTHILSLLSYQALHTSVLSHLL